MNKEKITKDIVILYHAECQDGFGAAWAAWRKFKDAADYIPIDYQEDAPPEGLKGKEIYTLDFTYPKEITEKLIRENKRVTSIDHHISSEDTTKITYQYSFSKEHSGSVLSWGYFHPGKPLPKILLLIEDLDLWRFNYPETEKFTASLMILDFDFEIWERIADEVESPEKLAPYLSKGQVVIDFQKKITKSLLRHAQKVKFDGYEVYAVNASKPLAHQVAVALKEKFPPLGIAWTQEGDKIVVSLRSDGSVDVSAIAKKFGGGGHKKAAGFYFPADKKFPWEAIKNE